MKGGGKGPGKTCPECNAPVDRVSNFCGQCGTRLKEAPRSDGGRMMMMPSHSANEHAYGNEKGRGRDALKVFVGGLPEFANEESVRQAFQPFGILLEIKMMDTLNKDGQRYCFVSFADPGSARACIAVGATLVDGKKVECRPADSTNRAKPGDWLCPQCGHLVFAKRENCNMCGYGGKGTQVMTVGKPGDWTCVKCAHTVFSYRTSCNRCGEPRPKDVERKGTKKGDWTCPNCGDLVFAYKNACGMCKTPKPGTDGQPNPDSRPPRVTDLRHMDLRNSNQFRPY
eukprot:gnl/TRDRNA2_/TRDRNA2_43987_c1_seq1.p1 gnl/TRDRNA2_/TRDRNA2_43987_c1~~gnl/TRDRNA2_/TRDRNA2_43987_c1_seq1.p1  ORF type:complete len:284 (+),score=24.14 gnl/TRDRNA2_/TRDRNA2_43987_c1_seq1:115-966(+)